MDKETFKFIFKRIVNINEGRQNGTKLLSIVSIDSGS